MKTIALIVYLVVLLTLSLLNTVNSKANRKIVLAADGILLYIIYGFVSMAINNATGNKLGYCLYDALVFVLFVYLAAGFVLTKCKDEDAMCCYGGFSLLYYFLERALILIPLIFIGMNPTGAGNADLIANYNQITVLYIVVMLLMDVARFYLVRIMFVRLLVLKDIKTAAEATVVMFLVNCITDLIGEPVMKMGLVTVLLIGVIMYYSLNAKKGGNVHK